MPYDADCQRTDTDCDCPLCFLIKINLQVCNVIVRMPSHQPTRNKPVYTRECVIGDLDVEIKSNILQIMLTNKKAIKNLKVDGGISSTQKDYIWNIECLSKNIYKFCFHAMVGKTASDFVPGEAGGD